MNISPKTSPTVIEKIARGLVERRSPLRRSLARNTWEGAFAAVFIVLTGGAFLTGFALHLGANDFIISLLAAIPFLAQVAQLISAYIVDLTGRRKLITMWSIGLARQAWLALLPLPFLAGDWRLGMLIGVVVVSNIAGMISTASWTSWMADLVPSRVRGRYFGNRNAAVALASISVTLAGGAILDYFKAIKFEGAGFSVIFALSCFFALAALILQIKIPEKHIAPSQDGINWALALEPFKEPAFRRLLWVFFVWFFSLGICAAFFAAHMITNLKMTFTQISFYASVAALVAVVLNKPWGAMIDRFGCKPVIVFCAFGISFVPLIWLLPRPGHLSILLFEAIYSGALWTGLNLATFTIPIASSPTEKRTIYLAMFSMVTGLAFFISSIIGGWLAETWSALHWQIGFQTIVNYHILFALSSVLRLSAAFLALSLHEPGDPSLPGMIQYMSDLFMRRVTASRQMFPWSSKMALALAKIPVRFKNII